MITLENVSIDTLGVGNRRVQWEVVPTHEDLNLFVLDVYRAEAPGELSEFDLVTSGIAVSDGMYLDSGLQRMDYSTNRQIYYYLNILQPSTAETSLEGPYVMETATDYVANDILRTYDLFFDNPRYQNRTFYVLKRRTWGNKCYCVDDVTQEVRDENCTNCYGTAFEGGYFQPIAVKGQRADKPSRQMINLFGAWQDTNVFFKLQNTIDVVPGDYIVDEHNERYLIEAPVNHLQKGMHTLLSNVRAKTVSKTDPIYRYGMVEELGGTVESGQESTQPYGIFDGASYVSIPDTSRLSFGTGPFSIMAWMYMIDATAFIIASKYGAANEWFLGNTIGDSLQFSIYDNVNGGYIRTTLSSMTAYQNYWMHLVATYDGSTNPSGIKIYLNKTLQTTAPISSGTFISMVDTAQPVEIGRASGSHAIGRMRDIKIFSKELTQADINQEYDLGNYVIGMVAHYKLYTNTDDFGRFGLDGTNNGVTFG